MITSLRPLAVEPWLFECQAKLAGDQLGPAPNAEKSLFWKLELH